jgi:hypothetical protein
MAGVLENVIDNKMCMRFCQQHFSKIFLIERRIQRDVIINAQCSLCEVPVILVGFQSNMNILDIISKNTEISNLR